MAITTEEAIQQARQMNSQRVKLNDITKHLADAGYVSERTGNPLKMNAVYAMIHKDDLKNKDRQKKDQKQEKRDMRKADKQETIQMINPNQETIDMLKATADMHKLPIAQRFKIMSAILKGL